MRWAEDHRPDVVTMDLRGPRRPGPDTTYCDTVLQPVP
jgi:hypothetical protein